MTGLLLIDKPSGPTSHDVVARLRRTSGERSIGHTGTLDPRATGLLLLVMGRATRLAAFLTRSDKTYDATIKLGLSTDTDDADGQPEGAAAEALPEDDAIRTALERFRGTFEQIPPRHSAKKIAGEKAYELARRDAPVDLAPVTVTIRALDWIERTGDVLRLRLTASSGFYVRALARDLGQDLGCGAHLAELRRTRSGPFEVDDALGLQAAEAQGRDIERHVLSPSAALPGLIEVQLTEPGLKRAVHGNSLGPEHLQGRWIPPPTTAAPVKVLAEDGRLVALAHSRGGALHPVVVLG